MANNTILAPTQTAQTTTDITVASGAQVTVGLYTDRSDGVIPTAGLEYWLVLDNPGSADERIADLGKCRGYATSVPSGGVYRVVIPSGLATYGVNVGVFTYT